jgi:hypothetical protein
MTLSKTLIATLLLAGAFGQTMAADVSKTPQDITLVDNAASFHTVFKGNNEGNTFVDKYVFTTSPGGTLTAGLDSLSNLAKIGLDITGFGLYNSSGLVQNGTQLLTGASDLWSLNASNLAADSSYYLQVTGSVVGKAAGDYWLNVGVAPVPEPETYGMLLGGLGLIGFMARRRNKTHA